MSTRELIRIKDHPTSATHGQVIIIDDRDGEMHYLADAPTPVVTRLLGMVQLEIDRQLEFLYDAKRSLGNEIMERMDRSGEWTVTASGVKIVAPSPSRGTEDWDAEKLEEILDVLVAEGLIDRDAQRRAVEPVTTYKVLKRGVTALLKIPAVRDRIAGARRHVDAPPRRVSVRVNPRELV